MAVFEVARGGNFGWEVTWRSSGAAEDVEGGLYVGLGVAEWWSAAAAAAEVAAAEGWKEEGVGVVGLPAFILNSDEEL